MKTNKIILATIPLMLLTLTGCKLIPNWVGDIKIIHILIGIGAVGVIIAVKYYLETGGKSAGSVGGPRRRFM